MRSIRSVFAGALIVSLLVLTVGCGKKTPVLTPQPPGARVVAVLNVVDAGALAAVSNGLIAPGDGAVVDKYVRQAIDVTQAAKTGWVVAVRAGLQNAQSDLSTVAKQRLAPYFALADVVLVEVAQFSS